MNETRRSAALAGAMLVAATVAGVLSVAVLGSLLEGADFLAETAGQPDRTAAVAVLIALMGLACAGVSFALYPTLRRTHPTIAIAAVGLRLAEGVVYLVAAVALLALVGLGQSGLAAGTLGEAWTRSSAEILRALNEQCAVVAMLPFSTAAFLYYCAFYQARLVPRWLSGWGAVAIAVVAGVVLVAMLTRTELASYSALMMPLALQEMVLAVWLIAKGFDPAALAVREAAR